MNKELKVKREDFKSKIKVIPTEMVAEGNKLIYKRSKKKEEDKRLTRGYIGKREDYER